MPPVSTPLNVDNLEGELSRHPNRDFSDSLMNALRYGTRVGYTGPDKQRVSRNLISATHHPEVVSSNFSKEISLGRVAGPFPSPPFASSPVSSPGCGPQKAFFRMVDCLSFVVPGRG